MSEQMCACVNARAMADIFLENANLQRLDAIQQELAETRSMPNHVVEKYYQI